MSYAYPIDTKARLLVLLAATAVDERGGQAARGELAMAKLVVPTAALRVIDRAIQMHGGAGVCGKNSIYLSTIVECVYSPFFVFQTKNLISH